MARQARGPSAATRQTKGTSVATSQVRGPELQEFCGFLEPIF